MSMRGPLWRPARTFSWKSRSRSIRPTPGTSRTPRNAWASHLLVALGANYQPMIRGAKQLMASDGGIGEVEHVMIHMASAIREAFLGHPRPYALDELPEGAPELHPDPDTSATPELAGGGYAQAQLSHAIGLALWLTGLRGREVYGVTWRPSADVPVEFHDAAVVVFDNGAHRHGVRWLLPHGSGQRQTPAGGPTDRLGGTTARGRGARDRMAAIEAPDSDIRLPVETGDGLYNCRGPIDALVDLAAGRDVPNASPGELGARVVEIIDALYRSARSHTPVAVP